MNLLALGIIGPQIELLWGRGRMLVIYLFSGLGGSCLAMALRPEAVLIGASGAIWGVLGALLMWFLLFRHHLPRDVAADSMRRLLIVVVLNAGFSFLPGISWQGHFGGGVVGFATAGLLSLVRFGDRPRRLAALVLLVCMPVACVGGLLVAMQQGPAWIDFKQRLADEEQHLAAEQERIARLEQSRAALRGLQQRAEQINAGISTVQRQLNPAAVEQVEQQAVRQLVRPGPRRNAEAVAGVQSKLTELKAAADNAAGQLAVPPLGSAVVDLLQARSRQYAEARSRSLGLLLEMLANDDIPDEATWKKWGEARRQANDLWSGARKE
jgi:rhomboid protease GluP